MINFKEGVPWVSRANEHSTFLVVGGRILIMFGLFVDFEKEFEKILKYLNIMLKFITQS